MSSKPSRPPETPKFWMPVLSPKQLQVWNCFKRYLLISGPRKSGKTLGGLCQKIARHAYDVPGARIAIFAKTIKSAKEGGVWSDLVDLVLPEWFKANIGSRFITPPRLDGQTRSLYCEVMSRHGTGAKIFLNSLDYDDDVEKLLKSRRFSMIAFSELSNFRKRIVFDTAIQALRIPGLPYEMHQFIADTNPSDEGEDSWIWKLWWAERMSQEFPESCLTEADREETRKFRSDLEVIEISIDENPFLSKQERDGLIASYRHDPDTYARYIEGRWVGASTDAFFNSVFREDVHVIGKTDGTNPSEWEVILPPENTSELFVGWDVGDKWPAVVFLCKERDPSGRNYWSIIDEVIVEGEVIKLEDLVAEVLAIMDKWEAYLKRPVLWRHYSDHSSFQYSIAARSTEQIEIERYSRRRIRLVATEAKYAGAAKDAIDLTKRLFFENRLFISASCPRCKQMFKSLRPAARKTASGLTKIVKTASTHPWDAYRYVVLSEEPRDLGRSSPDSGRVRPRIISMG